MSLASSNRAQVRYIPEAEFGVTPDSGNPNNLRVTGESLDFSISTETSQEIRSDRQTTDLVHVGASASGGVNIELSYKEFDPLIEAVMQGTWAHYGVDGLGAADDVTLDSTAGTLTWVDAPAGDSALVNLDVGDWFRIVAAGDPADGAYCKITSRTADTITVAAHTPIPGTTSRVATDVQLKSSKVTNGVTQRSFSIEKEFADVEQFFLFRGMTASELSLTFESGSILSGSVSFMGKDSIQSEASQLPGTPVESEAFEIMNSVTGVGNILEAGVPLEGTFFSSLSLSINNNLREQNAIGHLGAVAIAAGTLNVTGNAEMYLADATMYNKFRNNESTSLTFSSKDPAGNGYVFNMENVKFSEMSVQAGGLDSDVMLSGGYQALMGKVAPKRTLTIFRL